MKISVCVPVYNESAGIERFLSSVENQIDKDFELVIVDNNSSDNTLGLIEEYQKKAGYRIKILSEKQQGVGHARATGATYAIEQGFDILAGTDCDCDIHPEWIASIREIFSEDSVCISTGKGVHSIPQLKELVTELNKSEQDRFVYFFNLNNFIVQHTLRKPLVTGSNFALRADVYTKGGGFQQPYKNEKPAPAEDHELGKRLYDLGFDEVFMKFDCPSSPRRILQWLATPDGPVEIYGSTLTHVRQKDFIDLLHNVTEDRLKFRIRRVLFYHVISPISKFEKQATKEVVEWFFGDKTDEVLEKFEKAKSVIENSTEERFKFMDEILDTCFPYMFEAIEHRYMQIKA